jgi:DNA-directed RNA polymerase subunit RPC12/RpoP
MRIEGMPAMQCAEGHKRFVAPEFAVKMMEALLADPLVPLEGAAQKGLLKKRYCCPGCGQELGAGDHGRVAAKRVLEMKGLNAFGVQVDLPKYRCAACGRESVEPKDAMVDDLMKASVQAFRSAEVAPT